MLSIKDIASVYFVGIGGIGMSALARYFLSLGKGVSGYDKTATSLTRELEKEGMAIHYEEDLNLIPRKVDLVVYTPAIPATHKELSFYQQGGYTVLKRSEVLGLISNSSFNICIGGTHGKTTTSSMTAHILRHSGYGCNAFLGGITGNYQTNFWSDPRNVAVIEADEYDRSFLKLHPDIAVISSMDADHLDIYGTESALQQAFIDFSRCLKPGGTLLRKLELPRGTELEGSRKLTFSLHDKTADIYATAISMHHGAYRFSVVIEGTLLEDVELPMGGLHNVENSLVAIAIAHKLGIDDDKIRSAMAGFKGVKRRFEYVVKEDRLVYVDDYAHHPKELQALIVGARNLFPGWKCTVIFQPHLFSRTRDLAKEFSESLDLADEVVLLPIYPARELPMEGVSSKLIRDEMKLAGVSLLEKPEVEKFIREQVLHASKAGEGQILITAGAGDIENLVQPIKQQIEAYA